jgi:lantibiotic modifying enzyme
MVWPQADDSGEEAIFYGFAHGNAGIAYFLLAVYAATGEARYLAASEAAAETLVLVAEVEADRAYWAHGPERPSRWTYWCNGSSGVGTTLLRMYQVTGGEQYRRLAEMAGRSVHHFRWFSGLGQCHGLAGNGEFLLDLHRVLGGDRYLTMARELAGVLFSYRIVRDGRTILPDDSHLGAAPDFGVGTSGVGAFFHRLARGGARPFMLDELFDHCKERKRELALAHRAGR